MKKWFVPSVLFPLLLAGLFMAYPLLRTPE